MNTLALEPRAKKVSFDADNMWIELTDGRQLGVPLAYFPRLLDATEAQRINCIISGGAPDFIGKNWTRTFQSSRSCWELAIGLDLQGRHRNSPAIL